VTQHVPPLPKSAILLVDGILLRTRLATLSDARPPRSNHPPAPTTTRAPTKARGGGCHVHQANATCATVPCTSRNHLPSPNPDAAFRDGQNGGSSSKERCGRVDRADDTESLPRRGLIFVHSHERIHNYRVTIVAVCCLRRGLDEVTTRAAPSSALASASCGTLPRPFRPPRVQVPNRSSSGSKRTQRAPGVRIPTQVLMTLTPRCCPGPPVRLLLYM
jgi:hypothetical protein